MSLLILRKIELAFGGPVLLDRVDLEIARGERVCLLGRNGTGKSTLLGVATGAIEADDGEIRRSPGVVIGALPQSVPEDITGTVEAVVLAGGASTRPAERTLSRLGLAPDAEFAALSGGLKRRVLLARALALEPDLLLLDEPTNHLDVEAIEWLEDLMRGWRGAILFTTHDRRLIERVATRIVELDRGQLTSWPGDYANYLRRREERLAAEAAENARADRKLAEEEVWIRQGIKARRTRNEGRVRKLEAMRESRRERRVVSGAARFEVNRANASGARVIEAKDATFAYDGEPVIAGLDILIERGDRLGIIGPNGAGKTTLLRLLLGEIQPRSGEIELGTRIELAYFDQHRAILRDEATVVDSVADGTEFVEVGGRRRHVIGYLGDFLFTPERARSPVASLSGGERARLLLARLFGRPSNVLVMDEPTNDLDAETLELLEERLLEYPGTCLLVSHDRAFLDNVVTSTLVFEGEGRVEEYVGGYTDWVRQRPKPEVARAPAAAAPEPSRPRTARLGYMQRRELEALPSRIEALEAEVEAVHQRMADPELYRADGGERAADVRTELARLETELASVYERWEALEALEKRG